MGTFRDSNGNIIELTLADDVYDTAYQVSMNRAYSKYGRAKVQSTTRLRHACERTAEEAGNRALRREGFNNESRY